MKRLPIALTIAASALLTACSASHTPNVVAPTTVGADVGTDVDRGTSTTMLSEAPLPAVDYCDTEAEAEAGHCADDYVFLAATHFLGESDVVFENGRIVEVPMDEERILSRAYDDPEFREVLRRFDRAPEDGHLSHDEASDFENFLKLEQQIAAFEGVEEL